jgi:hypothetical protein
LTSLSTWAVFQDTPFCGITLDQTEQPSLPVALVLKTL